MPVTYPIMFERAESEEGTPNLYYAHVPALGLTTHGEGVEGARAAVIDLLTEWLAAKQDAGELTHAPREFLFSTVEVKADALQSA